MNDKSTPPSPDASGNFWNSGHLKLAALGVLALVAIIILVKSFMPKGTADGQATGQSKAQKALDNLQKNRGRNLTAQQDAAKEGGTPNDQPTGDPKAQRALAELEAKREAELAKQRAAEETVRAHLEYLQYQRRIQGLSHDPELARRWDERVAKAKASGVPLGPPVQPNAETLQIVRTMNKQLADDLDRANGLSIHVGSNTKSPTGTGAGSYTAGANDPSRKGKGGGSSSGAVPEGIDPETGLPVGVSAGVGSSLSAALPDGSPDLEGGAIPVQIQYTPPGSAQPITLTRWVRPGFLVGRVWPIVPQELIQEDSSFRAALRAATEIPEEKAVNQVKISWKVAPARSQVTSGDFTYRNRHVLVLPNPDTQQGGRR